MFLINSSNVKIDFFDFLVSLIEPMRKIILMFNLEINVFRCNFLHYPKKIFKYYPKQLKLNVFKNHSPKFT